MERFESDDIVRDLKIAAPSALLKIKYNTIELQPGQVLTPTQVWDQATVEWTASPGDYYALIMSDPDAPSRAEPKAREILHWFVGNIPGNDLSAGQHLTAYVGSGPPQGSGLHRYIFLLFRQQGKHEYNLQVVSNRSRDGRINFSTADFVKQHNLVGPVAGNYYQAEYDESVPKLHASMNQGN